MDTLRPRANLRYGPPGHEKEYTLIIRLDIGSEPMNIPSEWEQQILELVGPSWIVRNRGTRIEAFPPDFHRTEETDTVLKKAVESILGDGYELIAVAFVLGSKIPF